MSETNSHVILYFHGLPGGPGELRVLTSAPENVPIVAIDRLALGKGTENYDSMLRNVCDDIQARFPSQKLRLIGFSLGAMTAVRVAGILNSQVISVDLVSAAAPLELGDFLPRMAGRPVFATARKPLPFSILCKTQEMFVRLAPKAFFQALFSNAAGGDQNLKNNVEFRACLIEAFTTCFAKHRQEYIHEIQAYVEPWADKVADVSTSVNIWHGKDDNWTPIEMAHALKDKLGATTRVTEFEGLSHYSTLVKSVPLILGAYKIR